MSEWYERPPVPAELDRLAPFVGEWSSTDEHQPMEWMKSGGTGQTHEVVRRALEGYCYLTDIESQTPFGIVKGHAFTFFERRDGRFKMKWYDNFGNFISGEGGFVDDGTYVVIEQYSMNGVPVTERHTDRLLGLDLRVHVIETAVHGEYHLTSKLHYRRVR